MNTMTMRALMLGLVIALWAWLADVARLHVSLWAGVDPAGRGSRSLGSWVKVLSV